MDAIESRSTRQEEEWLIAVTTDHGGSNNSRDHGAWYETDRHIFLILSGDGLKSGEIPPDCETNVSHMDVFPSILEYDTLLFQYNLNLYLKNIQI